ncbi:glycosyltransferase family 9 protein [Flavobacterium sp.]|uniref:glycosyltransferase family 9 protein n=1 Tax=Flavobacterium sp. TaxID=239 RepID=UPI002B4B4A58|nr:glycosyltransferase family 9 protein [Flavobacterium sp.]HLP63344.1 glycosyltransferase family 9 protein [Flavobacterium sp.]
MSKTNKHIAVIRLSAMGDVAMTVPVILALTRQYPKVKITVVSRPFFKPIFERIPNVQFLSVHTQHQHKGLLGLFRLYRDLRTLKIDQIADLHNVLRSKVIRNLFALSGKKVAFTDKGRAEKKALTSLKNKVFQPVKHMIERHVETFAQLGYTIDMSRPNFLTKEPIPFKAQKMLGEKTHKWIGIAPFAHYESKTYPFDLMEKVVDELAKNQSTQIVFFGGKQDTESIKRLIKNHTNCFVFAGVISFEEELQLISNLDVMLSMDSGNAHLSALYGIPTITLWGATHPYTGFAPYQQPLENCLVSDREKYPLLPTSIYGNKKIEGYQDAMRTIKVEDVVAKVNTVLS